ncbi:MAG: MraY family glycosyltransferase [Andreesenia angusta]|nr:MraY family glycosyltransferase [Andreesenia angusta]
MNYLLIIIVPIIISFIATPFAKKIAIILGAIDDPKRDDRRAHTKPTPRLGGLAIYIAATISIFIFEDLSSEIIGLLIGSSLIAITGVIDDIKDLPAKIKLLIQIIAAIILYYFGIRIEIISDPIFSEYGYLSLVWYLSFPITIIWIVGVTNTINLIDGLDGLSAGISAIAGISMGVVAILDGNTVAASLSFILAGSALGFLPYNFNPASIFMGDTGALYLGFVLSAISIEGAVKSTTAVAFICPILILGLPILDTFLAMFRRFRSGKPIMGADRGHIHHRLIDQGFTQRKTVVFLYGAGIAFGILAIIVYNMRFYYAIALIILFSMSLLVAKNLFKNFMKKIGNRK